MVRLPRYGHPQGAKRSSSSLAWRPGWRGSGQQPIGRVPVGSYTGKINGVQLTGGQAQGVIPGTSDSGSVTSPSDFSVIAVLVFPADGTYTISWSVGLSGTVTSTEKDNFALYLAGVTLEATSVNPAAAGTYPQAQLEITTTAGTQLFLTNPNAGTSGAVYSGTVTASSGVPLTLQVGPQGLGTTWYPASITVSTSTGALDTSTAMVYLGPAVTPATLQATIYSGNGTAALAIPAMQPGQVLIVTWSNGHPGDIAALNVTGTMDALSTRLTERNHDNTWPPECQ